MQTKIQFEDLMFFVVATPDEYYVDFMIYDIDQDQDKVFVHDENYERIIDVTKDAEPYLHGSVKWDGCSNWWFDEQERGTMLHACTRGEPLRFGAVMTRCWDIAKILCPTFEGWSKVEHEQTRT